MRFSQIIKHGFEDMLCEHNVVNVSAIKKYVAQFDAQLEHKNAKEWFDKTLYRFLEKDDNFNRPMTAENKPYLTPDWLDAAIKRGDDIRVFSPPEELTPKLEHLVDWFNGLSQTPQGSRLLDNRNNLLAITVPVAIRKSEEWITQMSKEAGEDTGNYAVVSADGAYRWVEVSDPEELRRFGRMIQNCLGQGMYADDVANGSNRVFLLLDGKNEPHVAIRTDKTKASETVVEIKGKQNKAPVGRYVGITRDFLNKLSLRVTNSRDLAVIGLVQDDRTGQVQRVSDGGKLEAKIGQISVMSAKAPDKAYGGYGESRDGGTNYYFREPGGDDIAILNKSAQEKMKIVSFEPSLVAQVREAVKQFLNTHFGDGAPPPEPNRLTDLLENRSLESLGLRYDTKLKKYGSFAELGKEIFHEGDVKGYEVNDNTLGHAYAFEVKNVYAFALRVNGDGLDRIFSAHPPDTERRRGDRVSQLVNPRFQPTLISVLNTLKLKPTGGYFSQDSREDNGMFYNADSETWGTADQVGEHLWRDDGIDLVRLREHTEPKKVHTSRFTYKAESRPDDRVFYLFVQKGRIILPLCYNNNKFSIVNEHQYRDNKKLGPVLAKALNSAPALKAIDWSETDYDFDDLDVFYHDGRWGTRDEVNAEEDAFEDGVTIKKLTRGGQTIYVVRDSTNNPLFSIGIDRKGSLTSFHQLTRDVRNSIMGRYVKALFNKLHVKEADVVDSSSMYNDGHTTSSGIWSLGLFWDTRSSSWKLVQEGKVVFRGSDFSCVNFRNRVFFIKSNGAIMGWFKKSGDTITDIESVNLDSDRGQSRRNSSPEREEFLNALAELTQKSDYTIGYRESTNLESNFGQYGFFVENGKVFSANDRFPEEDIIEAGDGMVWKRRAFDDKYRGSESDIHPGFEAERYTLVDGQNKPHMRVGFSSDGYLNFIQTTVMSPSRDDEVIHVDLARISSLDEEKKKYLVVLLEKLHKKLTPTTSKDLGFFISGGKFHSMKDNPDLAAYLAGRIEFPDGHVLKRERHNDKTWCLGVEDMSDTRWGARIKPYLTVVLDDDGVEEIKFLERDVKRQPKKYLPYLHKLIDLFDIVSGNNGEDVQESYYPRRRRA